MLQETDGLVVEVGEPPAWRVIALYDPNQPGSCIIVPNSHITRREDMVQESEPLELLKIDMERAVARAFGATACT